MNPDERFELLWTDFLEGDLDANGMAELQSLLAQHSHLQERATDLLQIHRLLGVVGQEERASTEVFAREVLNRLPKTGEAFVGAVMRDVNPSSPSRSRFPWLSWRPLTAAAAGIVFGMFCTSVVYGFVARQQAVRELPLPVFEAGFENPQMVIGEGEPRAVREWSGERASVVTAENGVTPVEGVRMSLIGQIVPGQPEKMPLARLYQMIDLRTVPVGTWDDEAEIKVEAAFCASDEGRQARFRIRAFALSETPEDVVKGFWSRVHSSLLQDDDLTVSSAQWFPVKAGEKGWHRFSLKLPLPRGMSTLVILFGAGHAVNSAERANSYYLDDVRVTLLSRQKQLP
jgi:anti-sigma factor RsiW